MDDISTDTSALPQPAKKKGFSLFKKKLTVQPTTEPVNHVEAFSRAKHLFPARIKEEVVEREKKAAELQRKRSSLSTEKSESSPRPEKKHKVNVKVERVRVETSENDDDEELRANRASVLSSPASPKSSRKTSRPTPRSPTSLMGRFNKDVKEKSKEIRAEERESKGYISVSDSDSDDHDDKQTAAAVMRRSSRKSSSPHPANPILVPDDDGDHFSDEEFPELLAKARERKRLAALEKEREAASFANKNLESAKASTNDILDDVFQTTPEAASDPVVNIFITSRLQDSKNIMVKRKLSGRLREVRLCWCDRQEFDGERMPDELKDQIFLTWRNKQLFDATTCSSLGINFDADGELLGEGEGFSNGKIHMEAWTQDLYDACRAAAEIQDEQSDIEEVQETEREPERVKLILKANSKDIKDYKIMAKPDTTMQKLIDLFRAQNGIGPEKEIILDFDGDHLDPRTTVSGADMTDMDCIDVYIR